MFPRDPRHYAYSKYPKDATKRETKMRGTAELKNILTIGKYERSEKDDGSHPEMEKWDYYKTRFKFGNSPVYPFEIIAGKRKTGETEIYDIYPSQEKENDVNSEPTTDVARYSHSVGIVSENSVAQDAGKVKQKFSHRARPQNADTSEETKQLQNKAVEIFGKTYNWNVTGYVLPDGTRLDFSGKREGSPGKYREEDHRAIKEAYGEDTEMTGTEAMIDFMRRGAIRIMPESGGIQLQTIPTKAQLQALDGFISKMRGEVTIDIDDQDGNTVYSKDYDRGTFSRSILADIPELFEQAMRSDSDTARFHNERWSRRATTDDAETQEALDEVTDDPELYSQMAADADIRAAWQLLMRLHRLTTQGGENALIQKGAFEKRLSDIIQKIADKTGTKYGPIKLRNALRKIYQAMENSQYSPGEILQYARDLMKDVLDASPGVLVEQDETTKEILAGLKRRRFYLTDDQKSEIQNTFGTVSRFRQKNFGTLNIGKRDAKTASLEDVWLEDLAPRLPGVFAEDTSPLDMPGILDAWLEV